MSIEYKLVYGSWKIRFDEPLLDEDRNLREVDLPKNIDVTQWSIIEDLSSENADPDLLKKYPDLAKNMGIDQFNMFSSDVPLAIVAKEDSLYTATHLQTRIDPNKVHLIQHGDRAPASKDLLELLSNEFGRNYLSLNNWECLYHKGLTDIELEQKFEIDQPYDYYEICKKWWNKLDNREIPGFIPQLGDEVQYWSYDNHFCEIDENPDGDKGYVSIMQYCKQKGQWDDPLYTFKKKVFREDQLERWERNYENQWLKDDPKFALEQYFKYPLKPLPQWRRTRFDLACEYTKTGNLFMVNFEDCRIHNASGPKARLQQCEVEYLKTRGIPDEAQIYADFETLLKEVEKFMTSMNFTHRRYHYSKLSFLRDYVKEESRAEEALADA